MIPKRNRSVNLVNTIKSALKQYGQYIYIVTCGVLIAIIAYNIGHIRALEKGTLTISQDASILSTLEEYDKSSAVPGTSSSILIKAGERNPAVPKPTPRDMRVVISKKSSSKKYHFIWCPSADRIKQDNQVWFDNEQTAITAGYTLAGNCTR